MPFRSLEESLTDATPAPRTMGEPDWAALRDRAYNLRWATVVRGVIPLTAADPDLPIASEIGAEIARYVATPHLSYGPAAGLPDFTRAVARHFAHTKGASVDAARVTATNSAASALMLVARHVVMPGDEVVVQDPVDFLVGESVRRAGGSVRRWLPDADGPNAGRFTVAGLKAAVTGATRAIAVCHPHNPMGTLLSPDEVREIARFAASRRITVISDEVWSDVVLDGRPFESFSAHAGARDGLHAWVVYGLSKGYGLAGLRIGAVIAPDAAAAAAFRSAQGFDLTIEGAATISQVAATAALERAGAWREAFLLHAASQRDRAAARLSRLRGVRIARLPEATFVLFIDIRGTGFDEETIAQRLEVLAGVKVVPGSPRWFGSGAAGHMRLSLATTEGVLDEALSRIECAWEHVLAA